MMKDPIKKPLLRSAGQSLHEQIEGILYDESMPLFTMVASGCFIAIYSWVMYLCDLEHYPMATTAVAICGIIFLYLYVRLRKRKMDNLLLGLKGERAVAQYLMSNLVNEKCRVYNDVVFDEGFNIDHIIVSVYGVYVIETKTRRKPEGVSQIQVTEAGIHYANGYVSTDAIDQAQRNAQYIQRWLREQFNIEIAVKSAVV